VAQVDRPTDPEGRAISSMNRYQGGKREKIRALHWEGRALMKAFDEACLELEKLGIDFVATPQAPSLTDEQLLAVIVDPRAHPGSCSGLACGCRRRRGPRPQSRDHPR